VANMLFPLIHGGNVLLQPLYVHGDRPPLGGQLLQSVVQHESGIGVCMCRCLCLRRSQKYQKSNKKAKIKN
jgi:hypothetical protein